MRSGGGWPSGRIQFFVPAIDIRFLFSYTGTSKFVNTFFAKLFSLRLGFPEDLRRIHKGEAGSVRIQL
jgi:hypothetical protein